MRRSGIIVSQRRIDLGHDAADGSACPRRAIVLLVLHVDPRLNPRLAVVVVSHARNTASRRGGTVFTDWLADPNYEDRTRTFPSSAVREAPRQQFRWICTWLGHPSQEFPVR